jgi:circadian clock protein KaiC
MPHVRTAASQKKSARTQIEKAPTGIRGLDEVTSGGLPRGRCTLVCAGAGCGKTLMGVEFLVRGAAEFGEPGVLMAFEETPEEIAQNVRSLGFDLDTLVKEKKIFLDCVRVERSEIEETGDYDLEGLFVRLNHAIDSIGAKRVVLDTIEALFSGLSNAAVLRAELRRLFRWLKDKGVTTIITGERGDGTLTRQGLEEYVSDCVILLDQRVTDQVSTRRLRVVKYRGSTHGTNEYPFLIDAGGISVLPITSLSLQHEASEERVSSGISALDQMMGGEGYYRGSTIVVTGTAGTGKSSMAVHFVKAACDRGEKCLYLAFEESPSQLIRNMRSIGIDLAPSVKKGLLHFHAVRSTMFGLEMHLATIHRLVEDFAPQVVVVDPLGSLNQAGSSRETTAMLTRLIDYFKSRQITAFLTDLTSGAGGLETTDGGISSLVDTWVLLRGVEISGERNRVLYMLKSRGMAHSNQVREFLLTDRGIQIIDAYLGPEGVLTGSARLSQEAREKAVELARCEQIASRQRELDRKRAALEARIAALRVEFEAEELEAGRTISQEQERAEMLLRDRAEMSIRRQGGKTNPVSMNGVRKPSRAHK